MILRLAFFHSWILVHLGSWVSWELVMHFESDLYGPIWSRPCYRVAEAFAVMPLGWLWGAYACFSTKDSCFHRVWVESVPPDSDQEVEVVEVAPSRTPPPYLWRV